MASGKTRYEKEYVCTRCAKVAEDRDDLTVKKVSFHGMGAHARTFRSRVIGWLCPDCLKVDPDWNRQPYTDPAEADVAVAAGPVVTSSDQLAIPGT